VLRDAWWWARDYVSAAVWQVRAFFDRTDPASFASGSGTPLVMLPGIYETWEFLEPLIAALHAHGHPVHVVAPARRNQKPIDDIARQVEDYLVTHDLEGVVLVAHSKGGLVGKRVMANPAASRRVRGMVAVATPFNGSAYARLMVGRALRSFAPAHASITSLSRETAMNARIVSVYGRFDPHIPEGSELTGAKNVQLDDGGHFRLLAHPRVIAEVRSTRRVGS